MPEDHSDVESVYHETDADVIAAAPRRFALIDDYDDETGVSHREVTLYGLAWPSGGCTTVHPSGKPHGCWVSPDRTAERLGLELHWLDAR